MLQHDGYLFECDSRKPLDELRGSGSAFEIFEECRNRDARPTKQPCAAVPLGISFDNFTGGPVDHGEMLALMGAWTVKSM